MRPNRPRGYFLLPLGGDLFVFLMGSPPAVRSRLFASLAVQLWLDLTGASLLGADVPDVHGQRLPPPRGRRGLLTQTLFLHGALMCSMGHQAACRVC